MGDNSPQPVVDRGPGQQTLVQVTPTVELCPARFLLFESRSGTDNAMIRLEAPLWTNYEADAWIVFASTLT